MTLLFFALLVLSDGTSIAGQIFFKRGMADAEGVTVSRLHRTLWVAAGVVAMTFGFFCWLGLLPHFELSYLYPFESMDRIILAVAAAFFLREKLTLRLWLGIVVICAGTALVSLS